MQRGLLFLFIAVFFMNNAIANEVQMIKTKLGRVAAYVEGRDSHKETLLLLHGVFLSHKIWSDYVVRFKDQYNVVAIDWFGHGQSESPRRKWSMQDSVDTLDQIINALALDSVILVGHSWGGMAALRYADMNPRKVKALALFNTPLSKLTIQDKLLQSLQMIALPLKTFYGRQAARSIYDASSLSSNPSYESEVIEHFKSRSLVDTKRLIRAILLEPEDAFSLVYRSQVPLLAVVGLNDYVLKTYKKKASIEFLSAVHVIEGGHTSVRENSTKGTEILENFLNQI
jgi:pimeloyl-ACP methyl ester carboxylesterase